MSDPGALDDGVEALRRARPGRRWVGDEEAHAAVAAMVARRRFALEVPPGLAPGTDLETDARRVRVRWSADGTLRARVITSRHTAPSRFEGRLTPGATGPVLSGTMRNPTYVVYAVMLYPMAAAMLVLGALALSGGDLAPAVVTLLIGAGIGWFPWSLRHEPRDLLAADLLRLGDALWATADVPTPSARPRPGPEEVARLRAAVERLGAGDPADLAALEQDNHPVGNADLAELLRTTADSDDVAPELVDVADDVLRRVRPASR